ncbi:SCO family protein [Sulfuricurvum sp.]|jgi:protein SCO1/2|uniref:SCO family protein n=1 Tax=Sulfuricurvum sp. TaxID=2025608 RepID=UPI0025D80D6B|nr:SCO family protein [Sulfuricurvum sp.]
MVVLTLFAMGAPLLFSALFSNQNQGKIEVNRPIEAEYLRGGKEELQLVFFGYVGCTKICTPILHQLSDFYQSKAFEPLKGSVGFTFVNLMPEVTPDQPGIFAQSFNPAFRGVYLTQRRLMDIDRDFNLFFSKSIQDAGEINHSDYVYLVRTEKNGDLKLITIYMTHPLKRDTIVEDILAYQKGMK